ncbi:TIR-NBS-LRR disease resistance protein [Quillaja saponaria]|uniref:TIR-NBS-LRR disease resistance protein n=1 Tax=Quillaja saponaria TaxID=32244 RepID=A0AAD7PQJ4_QUISA|nr:TIR-NBS-LRR disease resistance protein [Quillaja saponaria]
MEYLDLRRTAIEEICPSIAVMGRFVTLDYLRLSFTNIQSIPASIKNISCLRHLDVSYCERLESLPQLPSSLEELIASGCTQLETITSFTLCRISRDWNKYISREPYDYSYQGEALLFTDCTKLDQKARKNIEAEAKLKIHRVAYLYSRKILEGRIPNDIIHPLARIYLPGSEIPEWFSYRTTGSSITLILRPALLNDHNFLGFAVCSVTLGNAVECKVFLEEDLVYTNELKETSFYWDGQTPSNEHVLMSYDSHIKIKLVEKLRELFNLSTISRVVKITFEFSPHNYIKKNGVSMVCVQDQDRPLQGIGTKRHKEEVVVVEELEEQEAQRKKKNIEQCVLSNQLT